VIDREKGGRTLDVHRNGDVAVPLCVLAAVRLVLAPDDGVDEGRAVLVERRVEELLHEAVLGRGPHDRALVLLERGLEAVGEAAERGGGGSRGRRDGRVA